MSVSSHKTKDAIEIVVGRTGDLNEIERFRYSIYIAEQQKPLPTADHKQGRLPDADDQTALHFCIRNFSGRLVGYARMHYSMGIPAHTVERLELKDILARMPHSLGFISKLMVDQSLRSRTNAVRLIMGMIQYGCTNYKEAEGAVFHCVPELVPLYIRMGFRPFGRPFLDAHVGIQTPMVAIFRDLEHFEKCGSPIAKVLGNLPAPDAKMNEFRDYFMITRAFAGTENAKS